MKDYYIILNIRRTATAEEIKRVYRRLAVKYHPDKNHDPGAEQLFKEINEAYEVIGDPEKRFAYDQKLSNPWSEILTVQPQPKHRDPAYKRKTPISQPQRKKFSDTYYLISEYLKYFKWMCWAGFLVTTLFFLDFILPYKIIDEKVVDVYGVKGIRENSTAYYISVTESGKELKFYSEDAGPFKEGSAIQGSYTSIYATPMWASNATGTIRVRLAYLYRSMILFPVILFVTSLLGIIFRHRVEFCFNLSIVSGVLLLVFWYLL